MVPFHCRPSSSQPEHRRLQRLRLSRERQAGARHLPLNWQLAQRKTRIPQKERPHTKHQNFLPSPLAPKVKAPLHHREISQDDLGLIREERANLLEVMVQLVKEWALCRLHQPKATVYFPLQLVLLLPADDEGIGTFDPRRFHNTIFL